MFRERRIHLPHADEHIGAGDGLFPGETTNARKVVGEYSNLIVHFFGIYRLGSIGYERTSREVEPTRYLVFADRRRQALLERIRSSVLAEATLALRFSLRRLVMLD